jgi:hypothetical protein
VGFYVGSLAPSEGRHPGQEYPEQGNGAALRVSSGQTSQAVICRRQNSLIDIAANITVPVPAVMATVPTVFRECNIIDAPFG